MSGTLNSQLSTLNSLKCAVVGGSGYIGGEITRLLLGHPNVELVAVTAKDSVGKRLDDVHPNFRGLDTTFAPLTEIGDAEVVFSALPNTETMRIFAAAPDANPFPSARKIIDASADFRVRDAEVFEYFNHVPHACFETVKRFVYGQPELFAGHVREASHVAAPGCFATAAILALYPLVAAGLNGFTVVNAVTGSSGSGAKAKERTHHPFRSESFFAYEPFVHRHVPEIKQALKDKTGRTVDFTFQPHSGPFVRGIFVTLVSQLVHSVSTQELQRIYADAYRGKPFVRFVDQSPNVKHVQYTNFLDINIKTDGKTAVVTAAIDNLLKGGAGQALQCFNLMHGFDETAGLKAFSPIP